MFKHKLNRELTKAFINERHADLTKLELLLKQDIFSVVNSYLDIKPTDIFLRFELNSSGEYELKCKIKSKRLKVVGFIE